MATESTLISSSPVIHVQSENSGFNAGIILTETNYDTWSQIIEMHIAGREKLNYIIGDSSQPEPTDPSYSKWYAENKKIKGWLLTSMTSEIMKRYLRLRTAREIWSALAKAFYDGSDETQIFHLNQRAFSSRQSGRSLPTYYGELVEIFQELDYRDKIKMRDPEDIIMYKASVEKLRIHIFLNGLDAEFEQVQGEILRMDPSLDLERTYAYVRREANRRILLTNDLTAPDFVAMLARRNTPPIRQTHPGSVATSRSFDIGNKQSGSSRYCTHCGDTGHTKSRCYDLIGYPEWWDHSKAPKRKGKTSTTSTVSTAIAEVSLPNTNATALHTSSNSPGKSSDKPAPIGSCAWIIDSGSTDHMSFDTTSPVSKLKPSEKYVVSTANGTEATVIGKGSFSLSKLNLDTVLIVPSLNFNLIFVSQITTSLHCVVIFWPDHCVFKDIKTRRTIGCGTKKGKLYYLDLTSSSSNALAQSLAVTSSTSSSNIWLWHKRFGHISFGYLKYLLPELFSNATLPVLKCETCELAKSHRVPFLPSLNRNSAPFTLIHSDVWGPAKVPTLNGARWFVSFIDDYSRMTWVCLMKTKQDVCSLFKQFYSMVATQYKTSIQVLRTDNGGEFVNHEMRKFLHGQGIIHQTTCPYTPQQNGVAERKNRHLLEMVRATLIEAKMPLYF
jgi:hypothetical protein